MAQLRKAEGQIEIKSSAAKFFDVWVHKLHLNYKDLCPDKLSKVELQGGTRHVVGSIIVWNYIAVDGNCEISKTKTEELDEENLSMTQELIDGHAMKKFYKSFKSRIKVFPKDEGSIVKLTFDYEKINDDAPDADMQLDFVLSGMKDIDARLSSA